MCQKLCVPPHQNAGQDTPFLRGTPSYAINFLVGASNKNKNIPQNYEYKTDVIVQSLISKVHWSFRLLAGWLHTIVRISAPGRANRLADPPTVSCHGSALKRIVWSCLVLGRYTLLMVASCTLWCKTRHIGCHRFSGNSTFSEVLVSYVWRFSTVLRWTEPF